MMTAKDIVAFLADCRRETGEPGYGAREVEIVEGDSRHWRILKRLSDEGTIKRRRGWCWLTEEAFERHEAARAALSGH